MNFLDRFSYVQELKQQIAKREYEVAELKTDNKKLVDVLCQTKAVLAPFRTRGIPEDFGVLSRLSVSREIAQLESRHNTKHEDE